MKKLTAFLFGLLLAPALMGATAYNQFVPANGILKGSTATPVTTAAAWSDVQLLLSGTCNSSVFVRADGTCVAISLTANVSGTLPVANGGTNLTAASDDNVMVGNGTTWQSKALTDCDGARSAVTYDVTTNAWGCNTISTISGAALTKTDDTNVTLTLGGSPTTALVNAASITAGWTGTLSAARGGLGMSTVTDDTVAVANGTTWQSKAIADCDDTSGQHLNYDTGTNAFSCGTSSSSTVSGANPTASVGLSAVNGVATTYMRSDGAPALSQSITPTWSGKHIFSAVGSSSADTVQLSSTLPMLRFTDTDAGADGGNWQAFASGTDFVLRTTNDANSTANNIMDVVRSGASVSSITFGNATNNPAYTFGGTGLTTHGGPVTISGTLTDSGANSGTSYGSGEDLTRINNTASTGWGGLGLQRSGTTVAELLEIGGSTSTGRVLLGVRNSGTLRNQLDIAPSAWTFGNSTDAPSYTFSGTGAASFGGSVAASGAITATNTLSVSGSDPTLDIYETDQASAAQRWSWNPGAGTLNLYAVNSGVFRSAFSASRSSGAVTGLTFGNATDNPSYTFAGSGGTSFASGSMSGAGTAAWTGTHTWGSATRFSSHNGSTGITTQRYDDNSATSTLILRNGGITATNQGHIVKSEFGTNGTTFYDGGRISFLSAGDYSSTGTRNSAIVISTATSETDTARLTIGPGVQVGSPTGGDKGAGTINATGLYINGTAVGSGSAAQIVRKSANTSRTSTSATVDPHLSIATTNGVTYAIQGYLSLASLNNGNGLQFGIFSNSGASGCTVSVFYPNGSNAVQSKFQTSGSGVVTLTGITTASTDALQFSGTCASSGGSIELYWAAATAGSGTSVQSGSWLMITPIS